MIKQIIVNIYNVKWTISFVPKDYSALASGNHFILGACLYRTQEIIIADEQLPESEFNTIAHELSHAILEQMTLNKDNYDNEDIAKFVGTYASYIVELTKDIQKQLKELAVIPQEEKK